MKNHIYTTPEHIYSEFPEKISELIRKLEGKNGLTRKEAREELVSMNTKILPYLHKLTKVNQDVLRWEVCKTIADIGDIFSVFELMRLLNDSKSDIRWVAAEGLINIGRKSVPYLLKEIILSNDSLYIREGVHHVLRELFTKQEKSQFHSLLKSLEYSGETSELAPLEATKALHVFTSV